jgi:hypothetical protein
MSFTIFIDDGVHQLVSVETISEKSRKTLGALKSRLEKRNESVQKLVMEAKVKKSDMETEFAMSLSKLQQLRDDQAE